MKLFVLFLLYLIASAIGQQVFRVTISDLSNTASFSSSFSTPLVVTTSTPLQWFTEGVVASPTLAEFAEDALDPEDALALDQLFPADTNMVTTEGPLRPGISQQFQITANANQNIHIITKYRQSNDLFFSFPPSGLPLFDELGNPISGDFTSQMFLYDAGTELNEEPGVGMNQPDRSGGPNPANCTCNENGLITPVGEVDMNGFFYGAVSDLISVVITPATELQLDITPLSTAIPLGEVVVVVAPPRGTMVRQQVPAVSDPSFRTSPLVFASAISEGAVDLIGTPFETLFTVGDATAVLANLNTLFTANTASTIISDFAVSTGTVPPGTNISVGPFNAAPGDRIFFYVQNTLTTDRYYAPNQNGLDIFTGPIPIFGDYTFGVLIWDAGILDTNGNLTPGVPPRLARNERPLTPDTPLEGNLAFMINPFSPSTSTESSGASQVTVANLFVFLLALCFA